MFKTVSVLAKWTLRQLPWQNNPVMEPHTSTAARSCLCNGSPDIGTVGQGTGGTECVMLIPTPKGYPIWAISCMQRLKCILNICTERLWLKLPGIYLHIQRNLFTKLSQLQNLVSVISASKFSVSSPLIRVVPYSEVHYTSFASLTSDSSATCSC